jgi:hypothetical protein
MKAWLKERVAFNGYFAELLAVAVFHEAARDASSGA